MVKKKKRACVLPLLAGLAVWAFALAGPFVAFTQARQVASGTSDAPQLTDEEFQRLYDRMVGTWHFQADKSTETQPANAAPRQRWYVTYVPDGARAIMYTNRNFDFGGEETVSASRQVLDGLDYPSSPGGNSLSRLPVNENTISTTIKGQGQIRARNTQLFSADGQRMTVIHRLVDEQGEHITRVHVWDKIDKIPE